MATHTLFIFIYAFSALICLIVSAGLSGLKSLRSVRNRKYRFACRILALASGLVGASSLFTVLFRGSEQIQLGLLSFPVLFIASTQSLMFTFLLILLFRGEYVTRRNIGLHALPSLLLTGAYFAARCFAESPTVFTFSQWAGQLGNPVLIVRTLFALVYLTQLAVYTRLFFRERALYAGSLRNLNTAHEWLELRWATRLFVYALGIGILAFTLTLFLSTAYEMTLTCIFALFYLLTGKYYADYHFTYDTLRLELEKAHVPLTPEAEEADGLGELVNELAQAQDKNLFARAEKLMQEEHPFIDPAFNRKSLVQALYTNERYLSRALRYGARLSIQYYLIRYRIDYAHTLLLNPDDMRTIDEIALASGFSSVRTFNRHFLELVGMTPSEFRRAHQHNDRNT